MTERHLSLDVEPQRPGKAHTSDVERNVLPSQNPRTISWEGPDDPTNPHNWSTRYRIGLTAIWIFVSFVTGVSSSIFSSGTAAIGKEFHVSETVVTLGVSLFLLGYTIGPPIWGPLSERFGRRVPLLTGMTVFAIFCIPVALAKNIQTILVGRFLCGVFGATPLAIVGGAFVDMWDPVDRGVAMAACLGTIFAAPVLAPLMGNFMAASYLGWRWTQWLSGIMGLTAAVLVAVGLPETFAPVLLRRKAARLRAEGDSGAKSAFDDDKKDIHTIFRVYLFRPFVMLFTQPILALITVYQAFIYGLLYLVFVSYPIAFREVRGWSLGTSALAYLGMAVGIWIGGAAVIFNTKRRFARLTQKNNNVVIPEWRLSLMIVGGCFVPVGLFIFAWTSNPRIPWIGMIIGSVPIGFGMYIVFVQSINYIVDVYATIANSALAANTFVRSFFGAGFPLFGGPMYHRLGVNWATTLLAFISILMVPIPALFYQYGGRIRSWSKDSNKTR